MRGGRKIEKARRKKDLKIRGERKIGRCEEEKRSEDDRMKKDWKFRGGKKNLKMRGGRKIVRCTEEEKSEDVRRKKDGKMRGEE